MYVMYGISLGDYSPRLENRSKKPLQFRGFYSCNLAPVYIEDLHSAEMNSHLAMHHIKLL